MRGDGGVTGEGRGVGVQKFHSWGKCTMPLTNINLDWMSNTSSGLHIILYYVGLLSCILGHCEPQVRKYTCNKMPMLQRT